MSLFSRTSENQINIGLAILRVVVGIIFVAHGAQKIFVFGFDGVAGSFAQMGIPMANILGPFVALVEFFGGLALIGGLFTRLAAFALAVDMLVAIFQVHLAGGFFAPKGIELALSLGGAALMLAVTGAGALSIDALFTRKSKAGVVTSNNVTRKAA